MSHEAGLYRYFVPIPICRGGQVLSTKGLQYGQYTGIEAEVQPEEFAFASPVRMVSSVDGGSTSKFKQVETRTINIY
jgi:hypothetical protein